MPVNRQWRSLLRRILRVSRCPVEGGRRTPPDCQDKLKTTSHLAASCGRHQNQRERRKKCKGGEVFGNISQVHSLRTERYAQKRNCIKRVCGTPASMHCVLFFPGASHKILGHDYSSLSSLVIRFSNFDPNAVISQMGFIKRLHATLSGTKNANADVQEPRKQVAGPGQPHLHHRPLLLDLASRFPAPLNRRLCRTSS